MPAASPDPTSLDLSRTFVPVNEALRAGRRWSTWNTVERGARGPHPRPQWVVTDDSAVDTELGVLKTGKEADVFLLERAAPHDPARSSLLAAKRYRSAEHRSFRRSADYTAGRRTRNTRDARALARSTTHGRAVAAGQWAVAEWQALCTLWSADLPVPYPVQVDGTELLMEYVSVDGAAAPRLAQTRPAPALRDAWFGQLHEAMALLARRQLAHGDLSPFNVLAAGERLVIIDWPQVVDIVSNPRGADLLMRDCTNVCNWFRARGADVHADELFADLIAQAW